MRRILLFLGLLLLTACTTSGDVNPFFIKTTDDVKISANFFPAESTKGVILLHMLNKGKNDWNEFASVLTSNGFNVIAIDLRGHGMSDLNWKQFSDVEFSRSVLDVEVAMSYLQEKGITEVGIIGASIGANIALKYAAQDKDVKSIILLSPSLNYRGIETLENVRNYDRAIFIVTSKEDTQSADDSLILHETATGKKKFMLYENAGHGTNMFVEDTLSELILSWLKETV